MLFAPRSRARVPRRPPRSARSSKGTGGSRLLRLAFSTLGCPAWTIEQAGEAARRLGYEGVEIRLLDGEIIPADLDAAGISRVKRALDGLGIPSVGTSCRFASPD